MDEAQLRIGNWVKYHAEGEWNGCNLNSNQQFQWEGSHWYCIGESMLEVENVDPLPLTGEWLLNLGLTHTPSDMGQTLEGYANENISITDWGDFYTWSHIKESSDAPLSRGKIKHVHQLQNLYFALTGKELTQTQN